MSTAIVWFRRDLRLADNPALTAALDAHEHVIPLYIHAPDEDAPWSPGAASRWWLHHALTALDSDLRRHGSALVIRFGSSVDVLTRITRQTGATSVYWNRLYEPVTVVRDTQLKQTLAAQGIEGRSTNAALLAEPWTVATQQGGAYRVFTAFWRAARQRLQIRPPLAAPAQFHSAPAIDSASLESLRLLPRVAWDSGLAASWQPSEAAAHRELDRFVNGALRDYVDRRDLPHCAGTSRLSAYLHFGQIGPMQVAWRLEELARDASDGDTRIAGAIDAYLRELGWREFSHHLLFHNPGSADASLNPGFNQFPWAMDNRAQLRRWQCGRTGIPIVDAGMRELWHTGWMHNRVRMVVASFLTKNLRLHWLHGARWFWDTLVDADLANNTQGWQWVAGSGADAAPYFRIFNPVTQGERFDPAGDYVRRWVPELGAFPANRIHQPWNSAGGIPPGYVAPMIDLKASRLAALAAYQSLRRNA